MHKGYDFFISVLTLLPISCLPLLHPFWDPEVAADSCSNFLTIDGVEYHVKFSPDVWEPWFWRVSLFISLPLLHFGLFILLILYDEDSLCSLHSNSSSYGRKKSLWLIFSYSLTILILLKTNTAFTWCVYWKESFITG